MPLPTPRNIEYVNLGSKPGRGKRGFSFPLVPVWSFEAGGKIGAVGAIEERIILRWGKTCWEVLDANSGERSRSVPSGPKHDEFAEAILVPESEVMLLNSGLDGKKTLWNMVTDTRRPLEWKYLCHLGRSVIISHEDGRMERVTGDEVVEYRNGQENLGNYGVYGDPLWYLRFATPDSKTLIVALDPQSGDVIWQRTYPAEQITLNWSGGVLTLQVVVEKQNRNHLETLNPLTGETTWTRTDPEAPTGEGENSTAGSHCDGVLLIAGRREGKPARYFFDTRNNQFLWNLAERASTLFYTEGIIWLCEPALALAGKAPKHDTDLVARDLHSGEALWRANGLNDVITFKCRLYSWRGKVLTCWGLAGGERTTAGDKPAANSTAKSCKGKRESAGEEEVVLKSRGFQLTGPEDEDTWRDLLFGTEVKNERQRLPVSAVLETLRAKFKEVNFLSGGEIEIYDRKGQFWGRLTIGEENLPPGIATATGEVSISGFRLVADEAVVEIVGSLLKKRKLKWEVLD